MRCIARTAQPDCPHGRHLHRAPGARRRGHRNGCFQSAGQSDASPAGIDGRGRRPDPPAPIQELSLSGFKTRVIRHFQRWKWPAVPLEGGVHRSRVVTPLDAAGIWPSRSQMSFPSRMKNPAQFKIRYVRHSEAFQRSPTLGARGRRFLAILRRRH